MGLANRMRVPPGPGALHDLKAEAWPLSRDAPNWRAEADIRGGGPRRFSPSMRQRIDIARVYRRALAAMPETVDGLPPLPIRSEMPTLDELLSEDRGHAVTSDETKAPTLHSSPTPAAFSQGRSRRGRCGRCNSQTAQMRSTVPEQTAVERHFYSIERDDGTSPLPPLPSDLPQQEFLRGGLHNLGDSPGVPASCGLFGEDNISSSSKESGEPHASLRSKNLCGRYGPASPSSAVHAGRYPGTRLAADPVYKVARRGALPCSSPEMVAKSE